MVTPKYLVSTAALVSYLAGIVPAKPGIKMSITIYANAHNGQNLRHVIKPDWMEMQSYPEHGIVYVGSFDFYGEFAPFTKSAIKRIVQHALKR